MIKMTGSDADLHLALDRLARLREIAQVISSWRRRGSPAHVEAVEEQVGSLLRQRHHVRPR